MGICVEEPRSECRKQTCYGRVSSLLNNRKMKKLFLIVFVALLGCRNINAQMIAVNTDALMDAMMTPSIGFELVTGGRSTLGLNVQGNHNPWGLDMKMIAVQPEYRYYFSGRSMYRHFIGIGGLGASYDIAWKGKVYKGNAAGMGITFGYVFPISHRWNIDCHAGFGAIFYKQKEYFEHDNYDIDYSIDGAERTNAKGYSLLPTRIGVSISYIIK